MVGNVPQHAVLLKVGLVCIDLMNHFQQLGYKSNTPEIHLSS